MALNWEEIKLEYITTDTSLSKLAEKYHCTKAQIGKVCAKEKWVEQREQFVADVLSKTVAHEVQVQSKRLIKLMEATNKAIDRAMEALNDEKQFNRYVVTEGVGDGMSTVKEKQFDKIDSKALKDFVGILKELTALSRDFDNVPTPAQAESQRIAAARLELEQKKADREEHEDRTITLVIPPELEGLGD